MSASARAATAAPAEKRTIYFVSGDAYEFSIAQAWAKSKGFKVVASIPLNRLTEDMVIVPIVRGVDRTPVRYEIFDKELGRATRKERKPEELVNELHQCRPVAVSDYWTVDQEKVAQDDFAAILGGNIDRNAFIDAMCKSTAQHEVYPRTHHGEENNILRLEWGT